MISKSTLFMSLCILGGCGSTDFTTQSGTSPTKSASIETESDSQRRVLDDNDVENNVDNDIDSDSVNARPDIDSDSVSKADTPKFVTKSYSIEKTIEKKPIDIIFAVDTSGSMHEEKASLQINMASFINKISEEQEADLNLIVVGKNFHFDTDTNQKLTRINEQIESTDAFQKLKELLGKGSIPIRNDSIKHFIVVTDDNARTVLAADFAMTLDSLESTKNTTKVHGIIGLPESINTATCKIAATGTEYLTLSENKTYGGMIQDLCSEDWEQLLNGIAEGIVKTSYTNNFPTNLNIDFDRPYTVAINGKRLNPNQFTFDANNGNLSIIDSEAIESTGVLTIKYFPEP